MNAKKILVTSLSLIIALISLSACNNGGLSQNTDVEKNTGIKGTLYGDVMVGYQESDISKMTDGKDFDHKTYLIKYLTFNLDGYQYKIESSQINYIAKKSRGEDIRISNTLTNPNAIQLLSMESTFNNDKALTEMDLLLENSLNYNINKNVVVLKAHEFSDDIINRQDLSLDSPENQKLVTYLANNVKPNNESTYYVIPLKRGSHWVTSVIKVENKNAKFYFIDSTKPFINYDSFVDGYASLGHIPSAETNCTKK